MSGTPRKPLLTTPSSSLRRTSNESISSKSPTGSGTTTASGQGLARTPSVRQTRPTRKFASRSSISFTTDGTEDEDEIRASNTQLISELNDHVQKAEYASEQYRKQLEVLQRRLDEVSVEQTSTEEREQQHLTHIDSLKEELKDAARQKRELQVLKETESDLILREREKHASREEELQSVIQRLNDTLRAKEYRISSMSKTGLRGPQSSESEDAQEPSSDRPASQSSPDPIETISQRDQLIDTLRLELVEAQIKIAEMEHMGDGRIQELEKVLMETKMSNARLREDNESFQYLLSEKTLKGDFMPDSRPSEPPSGMSSLAEELESAGTESEGQGEAYKKLEAEVKSLREGNKALTLYIDKIIGRLLQHEGFEHIIHDKDEAPDLPQKQTLGEKALPATPDILIGPSLLQRAKSVVAKPQAAKARPVGPIQPLPTLTTNENPQTAPSIPLTRGHRRARSDQAQPDLGAAVLVQQMNRASPLRTASGGTIGSGMRPLSPPSSVRGSSFQISTPAEGRNPSGSGPSKDKDRGSSATSLASEKSGEKDSTDASSVQISHPGSNNIPGAVMKQNQLRPLRLVREQALHDETEAQKKANRGSWMDWFKGATVEAQTN